jgi:hypothetical protein
MKTLEGIVTLVQEGRFLLRATTGESHLFVLSHKAPLEPEQLPPLQHDQARVRVSYKDAHDLIARIAHAVERLDAA